MNVTRPTILCVDDESGVLEGLALTLGRHCHVFTATSGAQGLEMLQRRRNIQVIISDMRMPEMNGAEFLAQARTLAPDATRMLLTGESDLQDAIRAVNEGQIFRFLQKPCPPASLRAACSAAVRQYELVVAERSLLDDTLRGAVAALADLLCLVDPAAFGKTMWIRRYVSDLCTDLGLSNRWQLDVAAMVSQLGSVTLGRETAAKVRLGRALSDEERTQVDELPTVVADLLEGIPRLEPVRAILNELARWNREGGASADVGAQVLRLAIDYDALHSRGLSTEQALASLREAGVYESGVLHTFATRREAEDRLSASEVTAMTI